MMSYDQWDIVEADVPYIDIPDKSSRRPVLIISPDKMVVLKITTHHHSDKPKPYEYELFQWKEAGLTAQSYVQCDRFISLSDDRFTGRVYGKLKIVDIVGVKAMMKYHGLIK